ncbi:putative glycosyltransferase EpsD [Planctomycetes bacterium CA13]|uniref:Putative glycosyltransferase EpsD n=1 Tax=Novipirellula herctigrandis TaxID=2527986 RepID=A0A5C5Z2R1_9BACT|nr:putative glycosyltransferase EpsD [Planctomycetes bacterium CA13]
MRILYHHRTLGDGAEGIHINEMVRVFRELGHQVEVVALVGDQTCSTEHASSSPQSRRWSSVGRFLPGITYELAEIGYNVIGKRTVTRAINGFKPDLIYDRYNSFSTAAIDAAREANIPVFLEVNAPVSFERTAYERRPLRLARLATRFERRICNQADHVFVVSTPLKEFLVSQRGILPSRVTVIPNGVDPEKFSPTPPGSPARRRQRKKLGIDSETVIGFVGILRPWHGLNLLLDAFASLVPQQPNLRLLIVGDGVIEGSLREKVLELGLENLVTFTGRVAHEQMKDYLSAIDIAVSPQATFYASPMKILEYLAMGIPTIAPDMANIRDIIRDHENGILFEPENASALHATIEELLHSPELSTKIGRNGRLSVERERNWLNIARQVVQAAEKLTVG